MSDDVADWVFDSVVAFLQSPLWSTPILTFIDQNCVVFDSEEENKFAFTEIHSSFKELVEQLLEYHLDDMGISLDQFLGACERSQETGIGKVVFDSILAADDFLSFKKMMVRRNRELEDECLSMLTTGEGPSKEPVAAAAAEGSVGSPAPAEPVVGTDDAEVAAAIAASKAAYEELQRQQAELFDSELKRAIEASLSEEELRRRAAEREEAEIEHALAQSIALEQERERRAEEAAERTARTLQEQAELESRQRAALQAQVAARTAEGIDGPGFVTPTKTARPLSEPIEVATTAGESSTSATHQVSEEDIARRREYLARQKEILSKMRQIERENALTAYEATSGKTSSPAAKRKIAPVSGSDRLPVIDPNAGGGPSGGVVGNTAGAAEEQHRMQLRLALARKLKQDMIAENARTRQTADDLERELDSALATAEAERRAKQLRAAQELRLREKLERERKADLDAMHLNMQASPEKDLGGDDDEFVFTE